MENDKRLLAWKIQIAKGKIAEGWKGVRKRCQKKIERIVIIKIKFHIIFYSTQQASS